MASAMSRANHANAALPLCGWCPTRVGRCHRLRHTLGENAVMFERFSEDARLAVVHAHEEARARGDRHLGTEHLLLGAIADRDGRGARLLRACGISEEQARVALNEAVEAGNRPAPGAVAFTLSASRALELAVQEADSLQHAAVGTDHLVIALAGALSSGTPEEEPTSARVLRGLGVDAHALRAACDRTPRPGPPELTRPVPPERSAPALDRPARGVLDRVERLGKGRLRADQLLATLGGALDLAEEEAIYFGRPAADGGDLLIGLVASPDALVSRTLAELDLNVDRVRAAVERARQREPPG